MVRSRKFWLAVVASALVSVGSVYAWCMTHGPDPVVAVSMGVEDLRRPVWITRSGNKFHRQDCPHARTAGMKTTAEAALRKGYQPCKTCRP